MAQGSGNYNEPFFWHRIVGVGWASGGVVVLEVEYLQGVTFVSVNVNIPPDIFVGTNSSYTEILASDYHNDSDWYAQKVGAFEVIQEDVVLEDDINDIWIWDGFVINPVGDTTGVSGGITSFGPVDLHFVGMQVAYDTATFNRPLLGDYVTHTHPNGHQITYAHGATPIPEGYITWTQPGSGTVYNGVVVRTSDPHGSNLTDFADTESWYWYHLGSHAGSKTDKIRQAWLVVFANDRTIEAELNLAAPVPGTLPDGIVKYDIRGYPDGTEFDISEGHITPKPPGTTPKWQTSGSFPLGETGLIKFNASGQI